MRWTELVVVVVALAASACVAAGGGGVAQANGDAAASADLSAGADIAPDTDTVATADAGKADAAADAVADADADAVADAAADADAVAVADAVADAVSDTAKPDVTADVAPDIAKDVAADIAPDVPPDVAKDTGGPDPFADPNSCGAEKDCKGGQMCIAPGESIGCGMCMNVENPCTSSAVCNKGYVCKPQQCACGGESTCQPGCAIPGMNVPCAIGTFCAPTGECVATVCMQVEPPGADKNCPPNFVCTNPGNPKCQRKPCTGSSQCQGACVKGFCYDKAGFCSYPPP